MKQENSFFKPKGYVHFSSKLSLSDQEWVVNYCQNPKKVRQHSFYPFILRNIKSRRFRIEKDCYGRKDKGAKRTASVKERPICYANHLDAAIYTYYAHKIKEKYEAYLSKKPKLNEAVIAYRSIPVAPDSKTNKSTISFVKEIVHEIRNYPLKEFAVICLDISSFFDGLDHKILKQQWAKIMDRENGLSSDEYQVFKNVTRFSYVHYHDVFKESEHNHGAKHPNTLYFKEVDSFFSSSEDFRENIQKKKLIQRSDQRKGIPQGSPISATLANLYMLDFDERLIDKIAWKNCLYRRYSDDLLLICPKKDIDTYIQYLKDEIRHLKLEIQDKKTQIYLFTKNDDSLTLQEQKIIDGKRVTLAKKNVKLEYLGFEFDGKVMRLKSSSLSKYFRQMKRTVRRSAFYASTTGKDNGTPYIFRKGLYRRFSYIGAKRRLIYKRKMIKEGVFNWEKTQKMNWGNFLSYAFKAIRELDKADSEAIRKQVRGHFKKLNERIAYYTEINDLDNYPK
ncbi:reverse transcriptase domain-containing protein [Persicobacter psychrovividus]|uniref:Reverse transcriptase domain-containing protein n=1 Tax=Persicobacter psychrovividus TaxID=387638 RepID=A0ABN6LD08_9BACT|nr:hypothetical protein PEPS_30240 [Persicobacter psychrovividus]